MSRLFSALVFVFFFLSVAANAESSCETNLGRIARKAVQKAISDHQDDACAPLKKGPLGIDKTKRLTLKSFELCENGPVVSASMSVDIECATSDRAMLRMSIAETVTASATANLENCAVSQAHIAVPQKYLQQGIDALDLDRKLLEAAQRETRPFCN